MSTHAKAKFLKLLTDAQSESESLKISIRKMQLGLIVVNPSQLEIIEARTKFLATEIETYEKCLRLLVKVTGTQEDIPSFKAVPIYKDFTGGPVEGWVLTEHAPASSGLEVVFRDFIPQKQVSEIFGRISYDILLSQSDYKSLTDIYIKKILIHAWSF